jgi:hypothetical protein
MEELVEVFTTGEGDKVRIGNHGEASNDTPAMVPPAVATQLEREMKGEEPDPKLVGHIGRPSHNRFRIVRPGHKGHDVVKKALAAPKGE